MSVSAVIVAAGRGTRLGNPTPKAFLLLGGRPLFAHSLLTFAAVPAVEELLLVVAADFAEAARQLVQQHLPGLAIRVVHGGAERQDSVANGVAAASADYVAVHDAARPFASPALVSACIAAAEQHGAAIAAVPAFDTLKRVVDQQIVATVDRQQIWLAQTPQVVRTNLLRAAIDAARTEEFLGTDEASLLERAGVAVHVVPGEAGNRKITTPDDWRWAEWMLGSATPS